MDSISNLGADGAEQFRIAALPRSLFFASRQSRHFKTRQPVVQPRQGELARSLSRFPLCDGLPFDQLSELASIASVRVCQRGEFLWRRGDQVTDIFLLDSGFVKIARQDKQGRSKTYGLYGPSDAMGLFAMCAGMKHSIDAVALNEGLRTICINAEALSKYAEGSAQLAANLRSELTRFSDALINKIEIISAGEVSLRVAALMMQLVERYGLARQGNYARLPFSLTLAQMSEIVGARLETIARVLGEWKRAGWLTTDSGSFEFSRFDKLRELQAD